MSDVARTRERFLQALTKISPGSDNVDELTNDLRAALLDFASETPDNCSAAERLEVGRAGSALGLKVVGRNLLLSDIAHAVEDLPLPSTLKETFPNLSEEEWDTFTRLTTLLYMLFGGCSESRH